MGGILIKYEISISRSTTGIQIMQGTAKINQNWTPDHTRTSFHQGLFRGVIQNLSEIIFLEGLCGV